MNSTLDPKIISEELAKMGDLDVLSRQTREVDHTFVSPTEIAPLPKNEAVSKPKEKTGFVLGQLRSPKEPEVPVDFKLSNQSNTNEISFKVPEALDQYLVELEREGLSLGVLRFNIEYSDSEEEVLKAIKDSELTPEQKEKATALVLEVGDEQEISSLSQDVSEVPSDPSNKLNDNVTEPVVKVEIEEQKQESLAEKLLETRLVYAKELKDLSLKNKKAIIFVNEATSDLGAQIKLPSIAKTESFLTAESDYLSALKKFLSSTSDRLNQIQIEFGKLFILILGPSVELNRSLFDKASPLWAKMPLPDRVSASLQLLGGQLQTIIREPKFINDIKSPKDLVPNIENDVLDREVTAEPVPDIILEVPVEAEVPPEEKQLEKQPENDSPVAEETPIIKEEVIEQGEGDYVFNIPNSNITIVFNSKNSGVKIHENGKVVASGRITDKGPEINLAGQKGFFTSNEKEGQIINSVLPLLGTLKNLLENK